MQQYILRRIGLALLALSLLTFFILRTERSEGYYSDEMLIQACPESHGACPRFEDPSLTVQYTRYMKYTLQGQFDKAWYFGRNSRGGWDTNYGNAALDRLRDSVRLITLALALSAISGITIGAFASIAFRGNESHRWTNFLFSVGLSMPTFWLGLLLLGIFTFALGWLPTGKGDGLSDMILPAITLAWLPAALLASITRSAFSSTFESDYVKLARIRGLSKWNMFWMHCLRNVVVPSLTSFGLIGGAFVTSLILTEAIFQFPGMGLLLLQTIDGGSYHPVLGSIILILAGSFILLHLLFDLFRAFLDPRIRYTDLTHIQYQV